jgi:hypothetical protein
MTYGIDVITIFYALLTLEREFLGVDRIWKPLMDPHQRRLLELYYMYKPYVDKLRDLKAKASPDWQVLNEYLKESGFDPMFEQPLDGIGVVSILDKLVQWLEKGDPCQIAAPKGNFPGFKLGKKNFQVYAIPGQKSPLIEIATQSEDKLFLMMSERTHDSVSIFDFALGMMMTRKMVENGYSSVQIPKIDFDIKPDITFLMGVNTVDEQNADWHITQAKQQFKFRMNESGARAKVATGLGISRGISFNAPQPLIFDRPFYGWFAQSGSVLPLAIFYADYDAWKEPAGSLETL